MELINNLKSYMEDNYINDEKISLWNVSTQKDFRTHVNDILSLHIRLNMNLSSRPIHIWDFINTIKKTQNIENQIIIRFNYGLSFNHRTLRSQMRDVDIKQIKTDFINQKININEFLNRISVLL